MFPRSIQLIAGRTGQEFNQRKNRKGAFWEDRYHATAIETNDHLIQCLIYIDLNMVGAGVVEHPSNWQFGGYNEILNPKKRYAQFDHETLKDLLGFKTRENLVRDYREWVEQSLKTANCRRDGKWTESVAVGGEAFVTETRDRLGLKVKGREVIEREGCYELRETGSSYNDVLGCENVVLRPCNQVLWDGFDGVSV